VGLHGAEEGGRNREMMAGKKEGIRDTITGFC
jgi:hypothetical protein